MNRPALGAAVLVISEREDRKRLFDLLDHVGYAPVYSARDYTHARLLRDQDPSLSLAVVEFDQRPSAASAFCEQIAAEQGRTPVVLLGVLGATPQFDPLKVPGVHDWLRCPIDPREVHLRLARALRGRAPEAGGASHLEEWPVPALHVDDQQRIVAANQRLAQWLGVALTQLQGQPLDAVLDSDRTGDAGEAWLKPRAGTPQRVQVQALSRGRFRHLVIQPLEPDRQARVWLDLAVAHLDLPLDQPQLASGWCERHLEPLGISLYAVIVESPHGDPEPRLLAASRAVAADGTTDALWEQPLYAEVLAQGESWIQDQALRQRSDPVIRALRLDWLYGLPLKGEGQRHTGVLLAGGQGNPADRHGLQQALRVMARRHALEWLAQTLRIDSRHQGLHDPLTRLPNRLLFNDRLVSAIAEAQRNGELFAVLFVDLDRFKHINDTFGHTLGDQVLQGVAKRIKSSVRASDTVARYAADEFTVVLRHIVNREDVLRIAEKMGRVLGAPLVLAGGTEIHLTASIGVAFFPDDGATAEALLKNADTAMFTAKDRGRNVVQTYVAAAEDSRQQRVALEARLRVAERNRELRAFYQPKVDTRSEDVVGMEALIRWEQPDVGLISPGFFIPLAEDTGLIVPIGEWILRAACVDCRRWSDKFGLPLKVSVNLSALQLKQNGLPELVESVLRETGLPAAQLDLEVTESMNVREIPNLIDTLSQLRALGCSISIDDFGTGQSSLEYLKRFPCDAIKVDQTFVRNIGVDPDDEAIIRATIDMAHNMGLKVIAEGVETEDHLRFLRTEQCEELQGFLFCRPLPALSFENLLAERERQLRSA